MQLFTMIISWVLFSLSDLFNNFKNILCFQNGNLFTQQISLLFDNCGLTQVGAGKLHLHTRSSVEKKRQQCAAQGLIRRVVSCGKSVLFALPTWMEYCDVSSGSRGTF